MKALGACLPPPSPRQRERETAINSKLNWRRKREEKGSAFVLVQNSLQQMSLGSPIYIYKKNISFSFFWQGFGWWLIAYPIQAICYFGPDWRWDSSSHGGENWALGPCSRQKILAHLFTYGGRMGRGSCNPNVTSLIKSSELCKFDRPFSLDLVEPIWLAW